MSISTRTLFLLVFFALSNAAVAGIDEDSIFYKIVRPAYPMTWLEARDSAAALDGYLAVISDQAEQKTITALLNGTETAWIGGSDVVVEGRWRWSNGETWIFDNWIPGQPDTAAGMDYAVMDPGGIYSWRAASGTADAFVVEWDCCRSGFTGNVNCDSQGAINILDISYLINYLYNSGPSPCCRDLANVDGDPDNNINLLDVLRIINFLYISHEPPSECGPGVIEPFDTTIIVDRLGKEWDVSYGVHFYGMDPANFNFGLGAGFFPPFVNPEFLSPGDSGYPVPDDPMGILATTINGESRAYKLDALIGHEVVNDRFDNIYVAPAY
ncbi:MAG TPA: DUF3179 domain-containing protein [candidate division Zixibacteria bacterium]|nr:DUF3179 domain-containing protein [candidate division Zixibacteria bacterium]